MKKISGSNQRALIRKQQRDCVVEGGRGGREPYLRNEGHRPHSSKGELAALQASRGRESEQKSYNYTRSTRAKSAIATKGDKMHKRHESHSAGSPVSPGLSEQSGNFERENLTFESNSGKHKPAALEQNSSTEASTLELQTSRTSTDGGLGGEPSAACAEETTRYCGVAAKR